MTTCCYEGKVSRFDMELIAGMTRDELLQEARTVNDEISELEAKIRDKQEWLSAYRACLKG